MLQNTPLLTCKSTSFEKSVDNPWIIIIAANIDHPWIIIGDFNLTRKPTDKNSSFNSTEANLFNDTINLLGLIEIPLLDRSYTWSNKREHPTLVHLDWCFVNVHWENSFPNTSLASLTRFTSDHVPLFATATSMIPKSKCFRFENAWVFHPTFKASITTVLSGSFPTLVPRKNASFNSSSTVAELAGYGRVASSLLPNEKSTLSYSSMLSIFLRNAALCLRKRTLSDFWQFRVSKRSTLKNCPSGDSALTFALRLTGMKILGSFMLLHLGGAGKTLFRVSNIMGICSFLMMLKATSSGASIPPCSVLLLTPLGVSPCQNCIRILTLPGLIFLHHSRWTRSRLLFSAPALMALASRHAF